MTCNGQLHQEMEPLDIIQALIEAAPDCVYPWTVQLSESQHIPLWLKPVWYSLVLVILFPGSAPPGHVVGLLALPHSFKSDMRLDVADETWADLMYVTSGQKSLRVSTHATMFSFPVVAIKYIPNGGASVDFRSWLSMTGSKAPYQPDGDITAWTFWSCSLLQ